MEWGKAVRTLHTGYHWGGGLILALVSGGYMVKDDGRALRARER